MKSYHAFFILLVIFQLAYEAFTEEAQGVLRDVSNCLHDDLKTSIRCIANVSTPLYNDLKNVSTKFLHVIQDHINDWIASLPTQTPPAN